MNVERKPQVVSIPDIVGMIKINTRWVFDSEGQEQFDGKGRSPNEFIGPCIDYLISLRPEKERDTARAQYQARIAKMTTPDEQLRFISGTILGEWYKNMP